MKNRTLTALSVLGIFSVLLTATPASARSLNLRFGFVQGTVSMSPLCPTEPCAVTGNPYENYAVTVSNDTHSYSLHILRNGKYFGFVAPGAYTIDITPNTWQPTCDADGICGGGSGSANVPAPLEVGRGMTNFDIIINTGIL